MGCYPTRNFLKPTLIENQDSLATKSASLASAVRSVFAIDITGAAWLSSQCSIASGHEDTPLHSFVPGVHFRTDAIVLCHLRDLADIRTRSWLPAIEGAGMVVYHSHLTRLEGGDFEQFCSPWICARHGGELRGDDHSWCDDGATIWEKSPSSILLSRLRSTFPGGRHSGHGFQMKMPPNKLALHIRAL